MGLLMKTTSCINIIKKITFLMLFSTTALAGWEISDDGATITDGNWTLGVQPTTVSTLRGDVTGLKLTSYTEGEGTLDFSSIVSDTGSDANAIVSIGTRVFSYRGISAAAGTHTLTNLIAPDCLNVDEYAFLNRTNLVQVTLSDYVAVINTWAFYGTTKMVRFHPTKMLGIETIGSKAFGGCVSLLGDFDFGPIKSLSDIFNTNTSGAPTASGITSIIATNVISISAKFHPKGNQITNIILNPAIQTIGTSPFGYLNSCRNFSPNVFTNLTSLGAGMLNYAPLTDCPTDFVFPLLTVLPQGLASRSGVTSITATNAVEIGAYLCQGCSTVTSVVANVNCNIVGARAFESASKLVYLYPFLGKGLSHDFGTRGNDQPNNNNNNTFNGCSSIALPLLIQSTNLVKLVYNSFQSCINLSDITIDAPIATLASRSLSKISPNAVIKWVQGVAPVIEANTIFGNGNKRIIISLTTTPALNAWANSGLYTPVSELTTELDYADFPGRRTLGLISSNGNLAWVIDGREKATIFTIF